MTSYITDTGNQKALSICTTEIRTFGIQNKIRKMQQLLKVQLSVETCQIAILTRDTSGPVIN